MTYKPKHLPPSLDYDAWLKEQEALPQEWNEDAVRFAEHHPDEAVPQEWNDATWPSAGSGEQISAFVQLWTANSVHPGPDWDSRSWWVERPVSPEITFVAMEPFTAEGIVVGDFEIRFKDSKAMSSGDTLTITTNSLVEYDS